MMMSRQDQQAEMEAERQRRQQERLAAIVKERQAMKQHQAQLDPTQPPAIIGGSLAPSPADAFHSGPGNGAPASAAAAASGPIGSGGQSTPGAGLGLGFGGSTDHHASRPSRRWTRAWEASALVVALAPAASSLCRPTAPAAPWSREDGRSTTWTRCLAWTTATSCTAVGWRGCSTRTRRTCLRSHSRIVTALSSTAVGEAPRAASALTGERELRIDCDGVMWSPMQQSHQFIGAARAHSEPILSRGQDPASRTTT
jgi:hypothetical protein